MVGGQNVSTPFEKRTAGVHFCLTLTCVSHRSRSPIGGRGRNAAGGHDGYDRYRDDYRGRDRSNRGRLSPPPRRGGSPDMGRRSDYDRPAPRMPDRRRR